MDQARLVFMGSSQFAVPTLRALSRRFHVVGVVSQPDRPAGRGRRTQPPPVKSLAIELDLPVFQPARLRAPEAVEELKVWRPDAYVVAAYGQILSPSVLEIPRFGSLNVHASLLPRWRGAAPIQAAILHGDQETGVTIMKMDAGLDTGPILSQETVRIGEQETAAELSERLAVLGADLLLKTLTPYLRGELAPQSQDEALATHAPMIKKEQGQLDFSLPAAALARQIRAYHPWPGSYTYVKEQRLKILRAHAAGDLEHDDRCANAGLRVVLGGLPAFCTGDGLLVLEQVQPAGKAVMDAEAYLRGNPAWEASHETRER